MKNPNLFINNFVKRLHLSESVASCAEEILHSFNGETGYNLRDDLKGLAAAAIYIALKSNPTIPKITQLALAGLTEITKKRLRKRISTLIE
ncbi:MAG: hypothetical protein RBG13Loki_2686 [Promethearchaeota archaeon CR_4]|nr:MAG: hypothetical protein RBG13Loki_2686 [Candidatus Lokiarchaeota archaeon CR_4]